MSTCLELPGFGKRSSPHCRRIDAHGHLADLRVSLCLEKRLSDAARGISAGHVPYLRSRRSELRGTQGTGPSNQSRRLARLPVQVRPRLGEGTASFIRRLARANHLPHKYLLRILCRPGRYGTLDLDLPAQITGRSVTDLRRTLPDAPGRLDLEPDRRCLFSTALDRRVTESSARINLVTLLLDAYQDGLDRHHLAARYGLDRRVVRIALQHQKQREPQRRTPDPMTLLASLDLDNLSMLTDMLRSDLSETGDVKSGSRPARSESQ